jgi:hypothetical protein
MTERLTALWNDEKNDAVKFAFWQNEADKFNNAQEGLTEAQREMCEEFHLKNLRAAAKVPVCFKSHITMSSILKQCHNTRTSEI